MNEATLAGLCLLVSVLTLWGAMALGSRRRIRERAALARTQQAEDERLRAEREERSAQQQEQGRKVMYRREMAQRELGRFYGRSHRGEDPTYEEWAEEHGYADARVES